MEKDECLKAFTYYSREQTQKKLKKESKAETQKMAEGLLKLSHFEKKLEVEVNAIARLIDFGCTCISCGHLKRAFAGHYHSVQSNNCIRFNLHNIHIQDFNCNGERGGNVIAYGTGLINRYGQEYRDYVEYEIVRLYPRMGWSKEQLQEWTIKARAIKKELESNVRELLPKERIELRNKINLEIGIYNEIFTFVKK